MSSEVSFASESMAFEISGVVSSIDGPRSNGRSGSGEPEDHDGQDKRERAEEVQARGHDRDAVVVGVEPEAGRSPTAA